MQRYIYAAIPVPVDHAISPPRDAAMSTTVPRGLSDAAIQQCIFAGIPVCGDCAIPGFRDAVMTNTVPQGPGDAAMQRWRNGAIAHPLHVGI